MSSSNFKVIVVGGGPVGLTAAHALTRAGIDFIVLESRQAITIDAGSNLVLLPLGMRLMGQIGLLDALNRVSSPLGTVKRFDHDGRRLGDYHFFNFAKENHGMSPRVISRHDLTKVMYEALPPKSQASMLVNKKVSDIATTANGVIVTCADGTSYEGSIVIGADGAHSKVRSQMRSLALQTLPEGDDNVNEEQPFLTTYRAMWVRFPTQADLHPGNANETHGYDCAIQTFAGQDTSVIGIYERIAEPTRERTRYGPADEEAFVRRWGDLPLSEELTVRDAYESRLQAGMVNLEEGVVRHWSHAGRIVLVGDAAHKFTPSTGAGCNNGIVDVAVLVNELHAALAASPNPSPAEVAVAFAAYQEARYATVQEGCFGAGRATAAATWRSPLFKFIDRHVLGSTTAQKFFSKRGAPAIARTPVLDFIEIREQPEGKAPWVQSVMHHSAIKAN